MKSDGLAPNELIVMGIVLIVAGIIALATIGPDTRVKLIIFAFIGPTMGIMMVILGVVRKFRKQ